MCVCVYLHRSGGGKQSGVEMQGRAERAAGLGDGTVCVCEEEKKKKKEREEESFNQDTG